MTSGRSAPVLLLPLATMALAACAPDPCVVVDEGGVVRLDCPDSSAQWAVPLCGNGIEEAGEACDDGTRACTAACTRRPGVSCASDDSLCVCDPAQYPSVFAEQQVTFYFHWVSLNVPEKGSHHFAGATPAVPGEAFTENGELGFDCDSGSGAPRLVIPPGKPHAFLALPFDAVDGPLAAAAELSFASEYRYYLPSEWIDRTLLVEDEEQRLYQVDVRDWASPCLGEVQNDEQLIIEYRARGLWCPAEL